MNIKPWAPMPIDWIRDGRIKLFDWKTDHSSGTAALELFYVICHFATDRGPRVRGYSTALQPVVKAPAIPDYATHLDGTPVVPNYSFVQAAIGLADAESITPKDDASAPIAQLTYDDFAALAGLSRKSIANGLGLLEDRAMIARPGSARSSEYALLGLAGRQFAKLPGQALLSPAKTNFYPFTKFHLRSRHEIEALKLLFYYASIRSRSDFCSEAKYETIADPQRDELALRHPHQLAVLRRAILCFLLGDPAPQQIRIEAMVQGYRRDRNTRLHALLHCLGLELGAMPTSAPYWRALFDSVHVST